MIDTTAATDSTVSRQGQTVAGDHGLFAQCPDCAGRDFLIEGSGTVLFACLSCDSRWRYALGYVWQVAHGRRHIERRNEGARS